MSISRLAIVVLGGKIVRRGSVSGSGSGSGAGRLGGALGRRVEAARVVYANAADARLVIVSGGSTWNGVVEADAMADELVRGGVPRDAIVRDRLSLTTRDNARYSAIALKRRGHEAALLITCAWHLPRATHAFEREGIRVVGHPVPGPEVTLTKRLWRSWRERIVGRLEVLLLALAISACSKGSLTTPSADAASDAAAVSSAALDTSAIVRAEDQRRSKDVPEAARTSHDVGLRRLAARAYARIADDASIPSLLRALEDEPAWTAFRSATAF